MRKTSFESVANTGLFMGRSKQVGTQWKVTFGVWLRRSRGLSLRGLRLPRQEQWARGSGRGPALQQAVPVAPGPGGGLQRQALLLVAVVDGAAREVAQPEQGHLLHAGRQRGRLQQHRRSRQPAARRGRGDSTAPLPPRGAPLVALLLGWRIGLSGGFLRKPRAVRGVPQAGRLVPGSLDLVQL